MKIKDILILIVMIVSISVALFAFGIVSPEYADPYDEKVIEEYYSEYLAEYESELRAEYDSAYEEEFNVAIAEYESELRAEYDSAYEEEFNVAIAEYESELRAEYDSAYEEEFNKIIADYEQYSDYSAYDEPGDSNSNVAADEPANIENIHPKLTDIVPITHGDKYYDETTKSDYYYIENIKFVYALDAQTNLYIASFLSLTTDGFSFSVIIALGTAPR